MISLNPKQKAELEHPIRQAILNFLESYDKPASLGEIAESVEISDVAIAFFHLNRLVKVGLVEKVFGTERYRVVER